MFLQVCLVMAISILRLGRDGWESVYILFPYVVHCFCKAGCASLRKVFGEVKQGFGCHIVWIAGFVAEVDDIFAS